MFEGFRADIIAVSIYLNEAALGELRPVIMLLAATPGGYYPQSRAGQVECACSQREIGNLVAGPKPDVPKSLSPSFPENCFANSPRPVTIFFRFCESLHRTI